MMRISKTPTPILASNTFSHKMNYEKLLRLKLQGHRLQSIENTCVPAKLRSEMHSELNVIHSFEMSFAKSKNFGDATLIRKNVKL